MNTGVADIAVGLAVAAALLYSVWRLGPVSMRRAVLDRLGKVFPALANRSAGSACESCGSCAPAAKPTQDKSKPMRFVPASRLRR